MTQPRVPPAGAERIFGTRIALAERFAQWLAGPGIARGLLGPREGDQIWERHVLNGVGIARQIPLGSVVVDLGTGAGLPGIPLLLARPDLQMVLVEPKARRCEFLSEVCADLGLAATVVRARATPDGLVRLPEGLPGGPIPPADVVTGRAVGSLADLGRWSAPLLRGGGRLLAVKGSTAADELERDRQALVAVGFTDLHVLQVDLRPATVPIDPASPSAHLVAAATVVAALWGHVSRET